MQPVDFSIVIPAYNNLSLLQQALSSVKRQKDVSMQIIIVDDSNQNNEIEQYVCSMDDPDILYRHNRPSLGAVSNWNSGLRLATGEYVVLIHHDEEFVGCNYLKTVKAAFDNADVVVSNIMICNELGHTHGLYAPWFKKMTLRFPPSLFCINAIGPCAVCAFKRNVLTEFDESIHWFVDVEWYYRLINGRRISYNSSTCVVSHHGHQEQITNTIDITSEAKKDATILYRKYNENLIVKSAIWIQIHVLHNAILHKALKFISGR